MEVGEMRAATDEDFEKVWQIVISDSLWKSEYEYEDINVWSKHSNSNIKMIKIKSTAFHDIDMWDLFDVLMDPDYRPLWDTNMIESYTIGYINSNNDLGYYAISCPPPIQNRDFVLQRSWLATPKRITVFNHSVDYADLPPKKYFIRGMSYITGYVLEPLIGKSKGCILWYLSATDPRGYIPMWAVNKGTQYFAPKMMKALLRACEGYAPWKSQNTPGFKPWIYPEQLDMTKQIESEPDPDNKP